MAAASNRTYRFTFGPWNISTGADPFGPPVRAEVAFANKIREYKKLGFDGVQFHDDDVVPADLSPAETERGVAKVKKMLDDEGLFCEFLAPRLWEHPNTIDGAYTSNKRRRPQVRHRPLETHHRHRPRPRLPRHRAVAGPRRHLHPRGQGPHRIGPAHPRRGQRAAGIRLAHPHSRRNEAQRADGPGVSADAGPFPRPLLSHRRSGARRRADRVGPLHPGRPRSLRRHGLRLVAQEALERPS